MEKEKHNDSKNIEKKTDIEELNEVEKFKKGKFSKVLLFFFGISIINIFYWKWIYFKIIEFYTGCIIYCFLVNGNANNKREV